MLVAMPTPSRVKAVREETSGSSLFVLWFQPSRMTLIPSMVKTANPSQWSHSAM